MDRTAGFGQFFAQNLAVAFELRESCFERLDGSGVRHLDHAVHKPLDLFLNIGDVTLETEANGVDLRGALIPGMFEHCPGDVEEALRRLHGADEIGEVAFDCLAADRFPVALAALGKAHVVRVLFPGLALRPVCSQRLAAIAAGHKAPEREVGADVPAGRCPCPLLHALLDAGEGLKVDEAFMMPLAQGHVPVGYFDISGIVRAAHEAHDLLIAHRAGLAILRELGLAFKEALHFALGLEATGSKARQCLFDDRGQRLVAHQ